MGLPFFLSHRPDFEINYGQFEQKFQDFWTAGTEVNNLGDLTRMYFLYLNVKSLKAARIPGALAELGVYKGNSAKLIHNLIPDRTLFLFDTFGGFREQDLDPHEKHLEGNVFTDTSENAVREFIGISENVIFCTGRFPETAKAVPTNTSFALVHLDCDLYEPTRAALEFFYPKMSPGGLIILHDYGSGGWPGVTKAVNEFFEDKQESLILIPDKSGTAVVRVSKRIGSH